MNPKLPVRIAELAMVLWLSVLLGCSSLPKETMENGEHFAVAAAKEEALRHGWKQVHVLDYRFQENFWLVRIYREPLTIPSSIAFVRVLPDGTVKDFLPNTR